MGGLASVIQRAREESERGVGERLFEYAASVRGCAEVEPMAPGDLIRASSLPYLCPREEALASKYDVLRAKHLQPGLQITMDIGHAFHDLYRDVYFGPMGEWVGAWRCLSCGWNTDKAGLSKAPQTRGGCVSPGVLVRMPEKCHGCHAPFVVDPGRGEYRGSGSFMEWSLSDEVFGIKGHPDGWTSRPLCRRKLVDLKSHGHRGFASRKSLREGHDLQAWAYGQMCGDMHLAVWYLNKSPWGDHPAFVREVPVVFDKKQFERLVLAPVEETRNAVAGGLVPERRCISKDVPRARECQLAEICFEL